jgi:hypothetical protein
MAIVSPPVPLSSEGQFSTGRNVMSSPHMASISASVIRSLL